MEETREALQLRPPCPKSGRSAAGGGIQHDIYLPTTELEITTPAFRKACNLWRLTHKAIVISKQVSFTM